MLIELIVSSAFFLIGKESINGGKRAQRTTPRPLCSYVLVTYPSIVAYNRRASPPDRTSDALRTWGAAFVTDGAVIMMPREHAKHPPAHFLDVWVTGRVPVWDEAPAGRCQYDSGLTDWQEITFSLRRSWQQMAALAVKCINMTM